MIHHEEHGLTLTTVTLTLRGMQKCNSSTVLLLDFTLPADIIFHKFLLLELHLTLLSKKIFVLNFPFLYLWLKYATHDERSLLHQCSRPEWDYPIQIRIVKVSIVNKCS